LPGGLYGIPRDAQMHRSELYESKLFRHSDTFFSTYCMRVGGKVLVLGSHTHYRDETELIPMFRFFLLFFGVSIDPTAPQKNY